MRKKSGRECKWLVLYNDNEPVDYPNSRIFLLKYKLNEQKACKNFKNIDESILIVSLYKDRIINDTLCYDTLYKEGIL